ncbi:MAG: archease [Chloroflexi bacterium]|nr:archease [Chloroflexota bacterium]
MNAEFEIMEHTADVGIIAYGDNLSELFANAAKGLFSLIAELDNIEEGMFRDMEVTAPDRESLLVTWLNELIYLFDTENIIFRKFDIVQLDEKHLKARSYGRKVNATKHEIKTGVKAATYHMLEIKKTNGYQARVVFDI